MEIDKNTLSELKEKLEKQKIEIKAELENIGSKSKDVKGDWDAKFPKMDSGSAGSQREEEEADEVEEYANALPVEHSLENRLRDIGIALEKIENGGYGKCENCNKDIDIERLKVYPEARMCQSCQK